LIRTLKSILRYEYGLSDDETATLAFSELIAESFPGNTAVTIPGRDLDEWNGLATIFSRRSRPVCVTDFPLSLFGNPEIRGMIVRSSMIFSREL
jgi:hypothetical protein